MKIRKIEIADLARGAVFFALNVVGINLENADNFLHPHKSGDFYADKTLSAYSDRLVTCRVNF